jgi:chemotaxis regulatin CheY-phosphate phosphatase CheZ
MNAFTAKRDEYAVGRGPARLRASTHAFSVARGYAVRQQVLHVRGVAGDLRAALEQFREDSRLADLAEHQVPDARQRLAQVLRLTGDAAHRTLDLVEKSCPLAEEAARDATRLRGMRRRATDTPDVEVQAFSTAPQYMAQVRSNLSEVLMAQAADLSGQIIRGVMKLVDELETGWAAWCACPAPAQRRAPAWKLHGPAVPGVQPQCQQAAERRRAVRPRNVAITCPARPDAIPQAFYEESLRHWARWRRACLLDVGAPEPELVNTISASRSVKGRRRNLPSAKSPRSRIRSDVLDELRASAQMRSA